MLARSTRKVKYDILKKLEGVLIVSSQASIGEPLNAPEHICALALSAVNGGARALRLEGAANVAYVRSRTDVPIVALTKDETVPEKDRLSSVYITPTFEDAVAISEAGADVIALDCTSRPRPGGQQLSDIIGRVHAELDKPVWADAATFQDGAAAAAFGADVISTTLSGYTAETKDRGDGPDFALLETFLRELPLPVVLEGKVWTPDEVRQAFELGAYAVVVGSAITRPQLITRRFVDAIPKS